MIIIAGTITLDPAKRDDALAAAADLMRATHEEPGCLDYQMYRDPFDDAVVRIFERWEDDESLKAHFAAPHMAEFQGKIGDFGVTGTEITGYDATARESLL